MSERAVAKTGDGATGIAALEAWMSGNGWEALSFQREVWLRFRAGRSGLLQAPTGFGKTYAAFGGVCSEASGGERGLQVLWVTPLKALANDTALALQRMCDGLGLGWRVEIRHGDVSYYRRKKQTERLPQVLIITPESLELLLSYQDVDTSLRSVRCVVVDEWHELLGSKRGTLTELCLSTLRHWNEGLRVWGLSATLGNPEEACRHLVGTRASGALVRGSVEKRIVIETLVPQDVERFPWAGHLGLRQAPAVAERIEQAGTSLIFTNTRGQSELWFERLSLLLPNLKGKLGLHHGSLGREERAEVERGLAEGRLRAVVCTSSLDLGVDFAPVDLVAQIGSPKGLSRLTQRAGRSGHRPGEPSRILGVPTNALEVLDYAAARRGLAEGAMESRPPVRGAIDLLAQFVVNLAASGLFTESEARRVVEGATAYGGLGDAEWEWVMQHAREGGKSLRAYDAFKKVVVGEDARLGLANERVARMHRMNTGVIASDLEARVTLQGGRPLGQVEERFLSRLRPGDRFRFAGKTLELTRWRDGVAVAKLSKAKTGATPAWQGGRAPLSSELSTLVSTVLGRGVAGIWESEEERRALEPLLAAQASLSEVPTEEALLVERAQVRGSCNVFFYTYAGRLANEGLAALAAQRWASEAPVSLTTTVNDYGFSLQSGRELTIDEGRVRRLLAPVGLREAIGAALNVTEMAKRQFREIARVAGLVSQGHPGKRKTGRQLHVSASLMYEMLRHYEADSLFLRQAEQEALERQLDYDRLEAALRRIETRPARVVEVEQLTPWGFPLWAETLQDRVSSEPLAERLKRASEQLERRLEKRCS